MSASMTTIVASAVAIALVAAGSYVAAARMGTFELTEQELRDRYQLPSSKFVDVDGINYHYLDEGQGDVILLMHGSYLNLRDWDAWAKALVEAGYRVVRFDRPASGLTAGYTAKGAGYAREIELLDGFIKTLNLENVTLVGTSSAGVVALSYAADHPEVVSRLILMNFPLGHSRIGSPASMETARKVRSVLGRYQPQYYTRQLLRTNLVDHSQITPDLVERMTDFANRKGLQANAVAGFKNGAQLTEEQRRQSLSRLTMPTLVVWSEQNRMVSVEDGREAFNLIPAAGKTFATLSNASHMVPLEQGETSVRIALDFLNTTPAPAPVDEAP